MHAQLAQFHTRVNSTSEGPCPVFALVRGRKACSVDAMQGLVSAAEQSGSSTAASSSASTTLFDFDHLHPASATASEGVVVVILHGFIGAAAFRPFHASLSQLAKEKRVKYVLRHSTPATSMEGQGRVRLSGFGVELAVKSTEYKAQVSVIPKHVMNNRRVRKSRY